MTFPFRVTASTLMPPILVLWLAGCAYPSAKLQIRSLPARETAYEDEAFRKARWGVEDEVLVVCVQPVDRRSTICEPYPRVEEFAKVLAAASLAEDPPTGELVIAYPRHAVYYRIDDVAFTGGGNPETHLTASNDQEEVLLRIRGHRDAATSSLYREVTGEIERQGE